MADCLSPSEILNAGTSCSPDLRLHRRRKEHAIGSGQADFPSTNGCRPCSGWTRQDLSRLPGRWSALSVVSCRSGCRLAGCPAWNSMCAGCRFWRCEKPTKNLATEARLSVQLHWLDVPAQERWRRVEVRNAEKGVTYQLPFDVTREMFDFCETTWEPPPDEEMVAYDGIRVSSWRRSRGSKARPAGATVRTLMRCAGSAAQSACAGQP